VPATDPHYGDYNQFDAPANRGVAVTPSDSAEFAVVTRAIFVGGAGNVAVILASGDTVTFVGVPVGTFLPLACRAVKATGTTATSMVALW
jgi:hypothetical protein